MIEEEQSPEDLLRMALYYTLSRPRVSAGMNIASEFWLYAKECSEESCTSTFWHWKFTTRKRRLEHPIPVCGKCGADWRRMRAHQPRMLEGVRVRNKRLVSGPRTVGRTDFESKMLGGDVDLSALRRHKSTSDIAESMWRSRRDRWAARAYFGYVLQSFGRRGGGGVPALIEHLKFRHPKAPHEWTPWITRTLVARGRARWIERLQRAGHLPKPKPLPKETPACPPQSTASRSWTSTGSQASTGARSRPRAMSA